MPTGSSLLSVVDVSKNLIRERAATFAKNWAGVTSEQAEKQTFWNELLAVFGIERRLVATFEQLAERASTGNIGWIDLLYPGQMAVEHKSEGHDLNKAMGQLLDYVPHCTSPSCRGYWSCATSSNSSGGTWRQGSTVGSLWPNFPTTFTCSGGWPVMGPHSSPLRTRKMPTSTRRLSWPSCMMVYSRPAMTRTPLREWLTRVLFCLFADDTEVWDRAAFHTYLARNTRFDGTDLGPTLAFLFQVLNTPPEQRPSTLDEDVAAFTYINGDLFEATLPIPACNESIRTELLEACRFDWSVISPGIFGSMFQNVMTPAERRQLGAHYTTEENILKTIRPLFLDDLEAQLTASSTTPALNRFHDSLSRLRFLDPACGCGNFLVIAYREIRRLETEALRRLAQRQAGASKRGGQRVISLNMLCKVTVDQFYGIEIDEWPARIARTALYLIDHIANREVSAEFGEHYVRFPIPAAPHIAIGNALRMDWNDLLPADDAAYVFGNPPFVGMAMMAKDQQVDNRIVFENDVVKSLRTGRLDYVACWYEKAIHYSRGKPIRTAFVSTNSISQGEQARSMGPLLTRRGFAIDFAHTTFAWTSEAKGKAHVHCVIVGFSYGDLARTKHLYLYKTLDSEPVKTSVRHINAWLANGPQVDLAKRYEPLLPGYPTATKGSQPTDGGHLLVTSEELDEVRHDPIAARYLRRFVQGRDMLHNEERWCLWLVDAPVSDLRTSSLLHRRLRVSRPGEERNQRRTRYKTQQPPQLFLRRFGSLPLTIWGWQRCAQRRDDTPQANSSGLR